MLVKGRVHRTVISPVPRLSSQNVTVLPAPCIVQHWQRRLAGWRRPVPSRPRAANPSSPRDLWVPNISDSA